VGNGFKAASGKTALCVGAGWSGNPVGS
jgi:hypothetical protein